MDRKPLFKKGNIGLNTQTGKRTILQNPIIKLVIINRNGKIARKEDFSGEYECFWHDENGETVYGTIFEEVFQLTS